MKFKHVTTIIFCLVGYYSFAQLNLPEDEQLATTAQSNYALLADNMKLDNYNEARKPLQWLIAHTPELHESMYIHGINLYNKLETDGSGKKEKQYQDTVMQLYDMRMKYFNSEKKIIDRKVTSAYKFYKDDGDKYQMLLDVFDRAYLLNGADVSISNLASYMDVVSKYDSLHPMPDEEVLKRYYHIMEAVDRNGESEGLDKVRGVTTNLLVKILGESFDCEFIEKELAPQLKSNPKAAKMIIMLSLSQSCTKEDFFADAAKILIEESPDFGLIRLVASKEAEKENYDLALEYYKKAIEATDDKEKKAKVTIDIARLHMMQGDYVKARDMAEKALELKPGLDKAYKLIGDLYFNSFEKCKQNENQVKDRAVFWVAYDMYQKAGDQESMANAKAQFPSIGEIFERNYEEGAKFTVDCWINRSTEIRRRPE